MARPRKREQWQKYTMRAKPNHGWKCKPGYRIFVADRGSVRFDFPTDWIVKPGKDGSIKFHDHEPPDDNCRLSMSVLYLRDGLDWTGLTMAKLLKQSTDRPSSLLDKRGGIVEVKHPRHDLAWREADYLDPESKRPAKARTAFARWSNIQVVLTFEYYADMSPQFGKVWDEILRTLRLGDYIEDPTQRVEPDPDYDPLD